MTMFAIAYQVIDGAIRWPSTSSASRSSATSRGSRRPGSSVPFRSSTERSSPRVFCIILATILGVAIGLFLSLMAPRRVATIIGPLVEMLAAIPSVVLGLIGIYLICPVHRGPRRAAAPRVLGFLPIFGAPQRSGTRCSPPAWC